MAELIKELRQGHLEAFEEALEERGGMDAIIELKGTRSNGEVCRSAITAEWFANGFKVDELANMKAGEVTLLASEVLDAYTAATVIDPS